MPSQVHAVSDYRMGEEICACIKTTKGAALSEDDVKAFCKDKVSHVFEHIEN